MRLLMIHADRFAFAVTGEANAPGFSTDHEMSPHKADLQELLVGFISVEQSDRPDPAGVAGQAADLLAETARKVGTNRIMVYPYAHLANLLASPSVAFEVVAQVHHDLAARRNLEVHRAPFGFYKSFELACKGHPLSELARTLGPVAGNAEEHRHDPHESKAIAAEKKLRSEWRIYRPDGSFVAADEFDVATDDGLRRLLAYERDGTRAAEGSAPHIELMREQELVGYEPASDSGNMRWYPKGILVKRLLEQHCTRMVVDYGAMEVETPIMYDYDHPGLAKYLDRFPARQYVVSSDDKSYFLRFAACFGQYMILHDMQASYRDLPVRLYELTHYSFRREQGGEVTGLRRLRAFTMPDMHSLVRDVEMAKAEFLGQVQLCLRWIDDIGVRCVPAIRFVKSFLDEHPDFVRELMGVIDRPALIEVWDERFFYFVAKFELNFVDMAEKAACLSTVQIDVENAERFDIDFVAEDGSKQRPLIMHTSVSGSVDRNVYAMLESQAMRVKNGAKAEWPVWLAPIQVRLVPVADAHVEGALALARSIPFRVDVDDRDLKMGKKVREAEREWVPYTIVVGARELAENALLTVRPRVGEQFEVTLEQLLARLRADSVAKPMLPSNTPMQMSRRPVFTG